MLFKDYYKILGVHPSATPEEIKRTYRKLALKYHPDRTSGDKNAETKFREVKEAYEVLSKPIRREGFDYDHKKHYQTGNTAERKNVNGKQQARPQQGPKPQQNWNTTQKGSKKEPLRKEAVSLTATAYLTKAQNIKKNHLVKGTLTDQPKLYNELNELLKQSNINQLLKWGDGKTNTAIVNEVLEISDLLSYIYIDSIGMRLAKLAGTDNETIAKVFAYCKARKKKINRQRLLIISGMILLIVLFILFIN